MKPASRLPRGRLQRKIFVGFGVAILLAVVVAGSLAWLAAPDRRGTQGIEAFVGERFAKVWSSPTQRQELAQAIAGHFALALTLRDARGEVLERHGGFCSRPRLQASVLNLNNEKIGLVDLCSKHRHGGGLLGLLLGLSLVSGVLWLGAGLAARRMVRPLEELIRVAADIGDGRLGSRFQLRHGSGTDIDELATAINTMAARIENQLRDQRELLAAVSHEIRTPVGHMRLLIDTAKERGVGDETVTQLETELCEIDQLVDDLLARSRLDFDAWSFRPLDAVDVARLALDRAGLAADKLEPTLVERHFEGDPTLLARALANLLRNAATHGGGLSRLLLEGDAAAIRFVVEDEGKGFAPSDLLKLFQPFQQGHVSRRGDAGALGLGLSLVGRIASVHGGRAWAENRAAGGARLTLQLPRAPATPVAQKPSRATNAA